MIYFILDSLIYLISTKDLYDDLLTKPGLLECMDTANLPQDHPCYVSERKKIPGLFSDETDGRTMTEFVALRAKSYAYKLDGQEKIKAKGIRGHVVKNHMSFNDHVQCLFGDNDLNVYRDNVSIRSFKHRIKTINTNKLTYNNHDDKRVSMDDRIHTLPHGHYKIAYVQLINILF